VLAGPVCPALEIDALKATMILVALPSAVPTSFWGGKRGHVRHVTTRNVSGAPRSRIISLLFQYLSNNLCPDVPGDNLFVARSCSRSNVAPMSFSREKGGNMFS